MQYTLWDSGYTNSINTYFGLYIDYRPLYPANTIESNEIMAPVNHKGILKTIIF